MFRTWLWLAVAVSMFWPASLVSARAAPVDIETVFADVEGAFGRLRQGDRTLGTSLALDIDLLTEALGQKDIPPGTAVLSHYYRALARSLLSEFNMRATGKPYDEAHAREMIAELEQVAAWIDRQPAEAAAQWSELKASTFHFAGNIAAVQLRDEVKAYKYWMGCAALEHAGCLNFVAMALVTGRGGLEPDLREALRMHKRVYDTGTRYRCAAVYSAHSAAVILALGGVKHTTDRSDIWIENALATLNALEADEPGQKSCGREEIQIAAYVIHLSRGKTRADLLSQIPRGRQSPSWRDIADMLDGTQSDEAFRTTFQSTVPEAKCSAYFYALWHASVTRNKARASTYRALLDGIPPAACRIERAYARLIP